MKAQKQPVFLSLLSLVLVCLYPCVFQYAGNAPESKWTDAMLFFGIFLAVGLIAYLIFLLVTRRVGAAGTLSGLAMLVFINAGLITRGLKKIFPWFLARYLLAAALVVGLALLVLLLKKKYRCAVPCLLLALSFGVISLISLVTAAPRLWEKLQGYRDRETVQTEQVRPASDQERPNVYFYIYDEYGGPECLEHFYHYDSSDFYDELSRRGFSCSKNSYNTQSTATVRLVPDLYDLSYDIPPYFSSGDGVSPRLYQVFQNMGYQVNLINHTDFLDTDGANVLSSQQHSDSIALYLYENSLLPSTPLASWLESLPMLKVSSEYEAMLLEALDLMDTAWQHTGGGPTLTLGYVQCPHTYFYYYGDGSRIPSDHGVDWEDPQYYLGYLEYANNRILSAVDQIQSNDPNAIIILQSDHGARTIYHYQDQGVDVPNSEEDILFQKNILNCVYAGGRTIDISGLSGVNTLRTVLNTVFGMDYAMLPDHEPFPDE